jgi:hypothetical protein
MRWHGRRATPGRCGEEERKLAHDGAATVGQGEGKEATAAAKKTKPDR